MAVATQTKGRNLSPYLELRLDDLEVLVARDLVPLAPLDPSLGHQGLPGRLPRR